MFILASISFCVVPILRLTQFTSSIRQNQLKPIDVQLKTVTKIAALVISCFTNKKKAFDESSIELFNFVHQFEASF